MQFMDDCMQTLPVVHSSGACFTQNGLTYVLDEQEEDVLHRLRTVQYYYSHQSVGDRK